MATTITVRTVVGIDPPLAGWETMSFSYEHPVDVANPKYLGDAVMLAIHAAAITAQNAVQPLVDLQDVVR